MQEYIFFSLSANKKLASELAKYPNCQLGEISITHFADEEVLVKTLTDVKNKDVVVIESTASKAHETLFQLLLLLDSINRGGAKSVKLFIPYLGYSRQERGYNSEPNSCEVVAKILETAKYDRLYSFDLHHPDIKTFFKRSIFELAVTPIFKDYYLNYFKEHNLSTDDIVIVSPDHGANSRSSLLADALKINKRIILNKVRPEPNVAEHLELSEDCVKGKTCIIIDDIIDTGGTLCSASKLLYSHGAKSVLVGATHGVFSKNCVEKLINAGIIDIAVTNTIEKEYPQEVKVVNILPIVLKYV